MPIRSPFIECATFHIDGNEIHGIPDFDATWEPVEEYVHNCINFSMKDPVTLTVSWKLDNVMLYKLLGLWDWVLTYCPDRRVVHLAKYAKKPRVRRKNFSHAVRLLGKLYS
jgi:hypothetical protein